MEHAPGSFQTTLWSVVLAARGENSIAARGALDKLCRMYWYPLYCYVRRCGHQPADAEDLVQSFFTNLIASDLFARADHSKGKLRAFLLTVIKRFLKDENIRENAIKRGGNFEFVSLDMEDGERRYSAEHFSGEGAESSLNQVWAREVLKRAANAVEKDWRAKGRGDRFDELKLYLDTSLDAAAEREVAARLGLNESNVGKIVSGLRKSYGEAVRTVLRETVTSEEEVDAEIAALRDAVGG